jgi:RNA polymerase sigma factor (sigma-70 family)
MIEDHELLRRYAEKGANEAFAELVRRRIGLVYSVALRQTHGDRHLAEDVTQQVFSDLARKAAKVSKQSVLLGWLYRSTQFAAAHAVRTEIRRRQREQQSEAMNLHPDNPAPPAEWEHLRPLLDEALNELDSRDRDAVLLRFFDHRPFAEIGSRLNLSENAARMRVERALDKLHALLARRGVTSTSAAVGVLLAGQAGATLPAGLAATVSSVAFTGTATASASLLTTSLVTSMKAQLALTTAVVATTATGLFLEAGEQSRLEAALASRPPASEATSAAEAENRRLKSLHGEQQSLRSVELAYQQLRDEIDRVRHQQMRAAAAESTSARRPTGPVSGPVFDIAQLDQLPKPRRQVPPKYPQEMHESGATGEALISFVVTPEGRVTDLQAVEATHPDFGEAAIAAIEQWEFSPGARGNVPVNTRMRVPMIFSIQDDAESGPTLHNWF